jgi:hypothetical protein
VAAAEDVTLAAIFGPQHGFRSDVQGQHGGKRRMAPTRGAGSPSIRSTAKRASRLRRCCAASTHW